MPIHLFHRTLSYAYGVYAWALASLLLLVFGLLAPLLGSTVRARRFARRLARLLFRLGGMSLSVTGLERLPARAHVLVVNHTGFLDALCLSALLPARPGYAFVARRQYRAQILLWPLLHSVGTLILEPPAHRHSLALLEAALKKGDNIVIFPEGGFVPEPGLNRFHPGAFAAAVHTNAPLVVAALRGTRQALRPGTWLPRCSPLALEIGPVLVAEGSDEKAVQQLAAQAWKAMLPLTGEGAGTHRF